VIVKYVGQHFATALESEPAALDSRHGDDLDGIDALRDLPEDFGDDVTAVT
jgi:hypothetical protein